jgi:hypothetical protein
LRRETEIEPLAGWVAREITREVRAVGNHAAIAAALDGFLRWTDDERIALVSRAVRESVDHGIERTFRLLALVGPPRAMRDAYRRLLEGSPSERTRAVEYVDGVIPISLRRGVMPMLEASATERRAQAIAKALQLELPRTLDEALRALARTREPWLRAVSTAAMIRRGHRVSQLPTVRDATTDPRIEEVVAVARVAEAACPT